MLSASQPQRITDLERQVEEVKTVIFLFNLKTKKFKV